MGIGAIDELNDKSQLLLELLPVPVVIGRLSDGSILFANTQALCAFGFTPEQAAKSTLVDLLSQAERRRLVRQLRGGSAIEGVTVQLARSDGTAFWAIASIRTIEAQGAPAFIAAFTDYSDKKRPDDDLRWKEVFDHLDLGVAICSIDDHAIGMCNQGFRSMYGYESGELKGRHLGLVFGTGSDEHFEIACRKAMIAGSHVYKDEHQRKDSAEFPVSVGVKVVRKPDGSPRYLLISVSDITAQRRLEQQFQEAQKLEAVGRLAGGIAHDFNNLLTVIIASSLFVQESIPPESRAAEDVSEVLRAAERARKLTAQLLAFSRRQIIEPQVIDLNALVEGMAGMLRRLLGEDIDLVTALENNTWYCRIDPAKLEQVIANLTVNARDAMPRGGKLVIETGSAVLGEEYIFHRSMVRQGEYVLLAVSDNGCGIPAEVLEHVFEPFYTTKGVGKGSGLGLASCYGIVKQAGGYIWAYSEPGRGTTFKVYLPRVHESPEPAKRPSRMPERLRGNETVLVAEDDQSVRSLIVRTLELTGYRVLEAVDGEQAVAMAQGLQDEIHLLLTDVVMPRMGGPDAYNAIAKARPRLKVLYISGYADEAIVNHGFLESGAAFVQKPFAPDALRSRVRQVLDEEDA